MAHSETIPLLRQYKQLRGLYIGYLALAVLALLLYFVDRRATLVALGLSLVYHLAVVRPRAKAYQRAYVHTCVQATLERYLQNAVHTAAPVLEPGELRNVRLVADNRAKGSILCREGGQGEHRGRAVRLGDVTFTHSFSMEGKTHHEFVTGMWVTVELGRDTGLDWRLLEKKVMMPPSRNKFFHENRDLRVQLEREPGWPEDTLVAVREGTPPLTQEGVLPLVCKLIDGAAGPLAVCIQGPRLHVFLVNRIFGQRVNIREAPAPARVGADLLPELALVLKLADRLS